MIDSKSTDKLEIICETIKSKILSDEALKLRVKKIEIVWNTLNDPFNNSVMYVPNLYTEFKD